MSSDVVLIVEDDTSVRQMVEQALEEWLNVHTILAADGLEALEMAWAIKPKLIILDIKMPEFDGLEVIKALQARVETQAIPVIVITAAPVRQLDVLAAGAVAFIAKPFNLEEFAAVVQKHLLHQQALG